MYRPNLSSHGFHLFSPFTPYKTQKYDKVLMDYTKPSSISPAIFIHNHYN